LTIVWDFGGVLFHWDPAALLGRVLAHRITPALNAAHWKQQFFLSYRGEWGEFDRGVVTAAEMVPRIALRTGLTVAEVQAVVDAVPAELQPIAGSVQLLRALHARGYRQYFLSNMSIPYAEHLQRQQAVLSLFAGGIYSAHVQLTKPDAAIFALAQQRFRPGTAADGNATLLIDDHPENIDAARRHGWQALLFTSPQALAGDLRTLGLID
jgi:putative hydrolase of the HAD superfamily